MATQSESWLGTAGKLVSGVLAAGRSAWFVGLGVLTAADEETRGMYRRLRDRGEKVAADDDNVMNKAVDQAGGGVKKIGSKIESAVQCTVGSVLNRAGVPSREEIRTLIDRVEQLTTKVDELSANR